MAADSPAYPLLMRNSIGGWQIKGQTPLLKKNEFELA
jgi:allophanate hydrolase subunit 1